MSSACDRGFAALGGFGLRPLEPFRRYTSMAVTALLGLSFLFASIGTGGFSTQEKVVRNLSWYKGDYSLSIPGFGSFSTNVYCGVQICTVDLSITGQDKQTETVRFKDADCSAQNATYSKTDCEVCKNERDGILASTVLGIVFIIPLIFFYSSVILNNTFPARNKGIAFIVCIMACFSLVGTLGSYSGSCKQFMKDSTSSPDSPVSLSWEDGPGYSLITFAAVVLGLLIPVTFLLPASEDDGDGIVAPGATRGQGAPSVTDDGDYAKMDDSTGDGSRDEQKIV